ncbi:MAG: DNA glycosylase AlkZ-like family protein, partial [Acidimicrobiales bacterium]
MTEVTTTRADLVRFRFRRHQLDRPPGTARSKLPDMVDYGVQDTGPDGAAWALAIRGAAPGVVGLDLAWTLRGAPHAYRRSDLRAVAVATAPYDRSDAAKRIFDASKPLVGAGIDVIDALRTIAEEQRSIVTKPLVKGEVSSRLAKRVGDPYLRFCRPCNATHVYENPFRLAALQAGLVLEWGTSPPVMRRVPRLRPALYGTLAVDADRRFDVIRNHLRFYPGARYRDVASFLDAPIKVVKDRWPDDAVEV